MEQDTQQTKPLPRRYRKLRYGAVGVVLVWGVSWGFLAWVAPDMVKRAAAEWAQAHGRKIDIAQVVIHPWSMTFEIDGVSLQDRDGSQMFAARRIELDAIPRALLIGHWHASLFELDQPRVFVERDANGSLNWARLVKDASTPGASSGTTPKFALDHLRIADGQVHFLDHLPGATPNYDLHGVNLDLHDLTTLPGQGGYSLAATLGDQARITWRGTLDLTPVSSSGHFTLHDLPLASVWDYVHPYLKLAPPQGKVSLDLNYAFALDHTRPRLTLTSIFTRLEGLSAIAPDGQRRFALQTCSLEDGIVDLQKRSVYFKRVLLRKGDLTAIRAPGGAIDWLAALPARQAAAGKPVSTKSAPGWKLRLGELRAENWTLDYTDGTFIHPLHLSTGVPLLSLGIQVNDKQALEVGKLSANLQNLQLGALGSAPLIRLDQAQLNDVSLSGQRIQPGHLSLHAPAISMTRAPNGDIDLLALFKQRSKTAEAKSAEEQSGNGGQARTHWQWSLPRVDMDSGKVTWRDRQPGRPVLIEVGDLAASMTPAAGSSMIDAELGGHIGRGSFNLKGAVDPGSAHFNGALQAQALPLAPLAPYALSQTPLSLAPGSTASAKFDIAYDAHGLNLSGQAGIANLAIIEAGMSAPLIGWHALNLSGVKLASNPMSLTVNNVLLDRPVARLVLDQHRQSNFRLLFAGNAAKPAAAPAKTAPAFNFAVRAIHVKNGDVDFADQGMKPAFTSQIHQLTGTVTGLSSRPGQRGTLALAGAVDQAGDVHVRGVLAPMAITDNADITLQFRNIALTSLNAYSENIAGWQIDDGRLSVGLHYVLNNRNLDGENHIVVDSIQLGQRIERPGVSSLPLGLAVDILEDSNHRIDLNLPVSGNLDDPKFSYGGIVWQAFVNVIEKAVTAPFRALGSLLGMDGFDDVRFVAGEAAVAPPEREKLGQLTKMLIQRPQMNLTISGSYDPVADRRELARARVDRAILAVAGVTLSADEPLPAIDMQDTAMQSAVKSVYAQRIGRLKLLQRLLTGKGGPDFYAGLRREIIAAEPVDQTALITLANARASGALQFIKQSQPDLASRVTLGAPQSAKASADGVPLVIDLTHH
jgi:uncharacterized protein involved in outer membrane biogenesis